MTKLAYLLMAIALFAAGMATGWWMAQTRVTTPVSVSPLPNPTPSERSAGFTKNTSRETLWLAVDYDGGSSIVPAVILKNRGVMVASLYNVYPANSVHWIDDVTGQPVFANIVAASHLTQLIAFEYSGTISDGLVLSEDSGTLFVGTDVVLQLPQENFAGIVQSPLNRDANGKETFRLNFTRRQAPSGGPLINPDNRQIIGYAIQERRATPDQGNGATYAVDATHIRTLLDNHRLSTPLDAAAFSDFWASTDDGIRLSVMALYQLQRWAMAYRQSEKLWSQVADIRDSDQHLLTSSAYLSAHQLVDRGQSDEAISLITAMRARFPGERRWCLVMSRAYAAKENWLEAVEQINRCLDQPAPPDTGLSGEQQQAILEMESRPALISLAQQLLIALARNPGILHAKKVQALQRGLRDHPDATLFRLLGDLEYDVQNYADANRYYQSAIRLDPSLTSQLGNRVQNSQQRAATAPLAEISFEQRRGAIIVNARLNDDRQNFRFLLDTGATYSAVSRATLLRLGLNAIFSNGAPVIELESAAGPVYAQLTQLASIQIGAARVEHVPVVILENLEGVDGLIGLSFLQHFDVNLDHQAGKLILTRR